MLRRRYHQKEKIAGETKGREKAHAPVWNGAGAQRSVYRCAEDGFLSYTPLGEPPFPFLPAECLCFSGHRCLSAAARAELERKLPAVLAEYYGAGKRFFLSGGALGFDTLAAQAVLAMKPACPEARLVLALPCRSQASRWSEGDRRIYRELLSAADHVLYVSEDYFPGCMQKRNRFLVNHADTCLCYLTNCRGGTWNTVSYAYDCQRTIRNLAAE